MSVSPGKDLIILVPDKNMQFGIGALLNRKDSLEIKEISYDIRIHPDRDPGVYARSSDFLRPFINYYSYALVFFDHEGCGQEQTPSNEIEIRIKESLERNGWKDRVEVIVFEPELEIWIWLESIHTAKTLGWDSYSELRKWLEENGLWGKNASKPERPKEALELSLRAKRIPRSSSIYREIAEKVSLNRCQDPSFEKFKGLLSNWFPVDKPS